MGANEKAAEGFWSLYVRTITSCVLATAVLTAVICSTYILIAGMIEDRRPEPIGHVIMGAIMFVGVAVSFSFIMAIPILFLTMVICAPVWAVVRLWSLYGGRATKLNVAMAAITSAVIGWVCLIFILRRSFYYDSFVEAVFSVYGMSSFAVGIVISPIVAGAIFARRAGASGPASG